MADIPLRAKPGARGHHQRLGVPALAAHCVWHRPGGLGVRCSGFRWNVRRNSAPRWRSSRDCRRDLLRLARHSGTREALVFRRAGGSRLGLSRDELVRASLEPSALPAELAAPLARLWPPATLVRPCAELLLHADLRPDDRLLVLGPAWPWLVALLEGLRRHSGDRPPLHPAWRSRRRNARPSWSPPRRPSRRRRSSAHATARTSPAYARSSQPAARSRQRAGAASTPG